MSDPAGQAPRPRTRPIAWRIAGLAHWVAHHTGAIALALVVMLATGFGALAWRLSQGPLPSPFLAHWLEQAITADHRPTVVHVGAASLAWNGFTDGVGSPLVIRVTGLAATDAAGRTVMSVPSAQAALSVPQLLLGRLRPTEVTIDRPELRIRHAADGGISLDLGGPAAAPNTDVTSNPGNSLLAEMAQPARTDRTTEPPTTAALERLSHLRRLRIIDAHVTVADQRLGATWQAPRATIDMRRQASGAVVGSADALLALGSQQARLSLRADLAAGGAETRFTAKLDDITPAALAGEAPALHRLDALDAPVTLTASGTLGPGLELHEGRLDARVGAGILRLGGDPIRLHALHLVVSGSETHPVLDELRISVAADPAATPTVIAATGSAVRGDTSWRSDLSLTIDQLAFADLSALWPAIQTSGARTWLTQNLTAGTAHDGRIHVGLTAPPDLSDITLASATGTLQAEDATVHWLRPVPPAEHVNATLRIVDPDTLDIEFTGGRQHSSLAATATARPPAGLELRHGSMRITGIVHPHQFGVIDTDLAGSLPELVALLREKRLHLLDKHPVAVKDPQGQATVKLNVRLPLEDKVTIDDIAIRVGAHLDAVHLAGVAAGRDLDQGVLDITANNDGMTVQGHAQVAGFDSQLAMEMDFKSGPPAQITQKVTATGRAQAAQLARIGLDAGTVLAGTVGLQVTYQQRRDSQGDLSLAVDMRDAALTALILDWRKPAGSPAHAAFHALLDHDRLVGVDHLSVAAEGLSAEGHADYADGKPSVLRLDRMVLGRSDATGSIRFAAQPGDPIRIDMTGRQVDLSARFSHHESPGAPPADAPAKVDAGTPYVIDAHFARALMSRGQTVSALTLHAENDGRLFQRARLDGRADPGAAFRFDITPERGGRRLSATSADAGQLLRALDIMDGMEGGRLAINGRFADTQPGRPLGGMLTVRDFRLRNVPFMARLLQGLTLYGLVTLVNGPGLEFSRMEAPFSLSNDVLSLGESRMFNAALGLTARGTIDINADTAELTGTIVPAYFFNSLLGRVPLVGQLFSPERGSGLFAANYSVRGRLADPTVSINPLSALTPGFLRNVFGMF